MKKRFLLPVFMLFFTLLPGVCSAFVPEASHLLYLVIEKIRQPVGIEAFQTKMILNYEDTQEGYTELEEKLYFRYPNQFRSEVISDAMTSFNVESDFEYIKVMDGVTIAKEKSPVDLYTDILLYRDHEGLLNQLIMTGIDTGKVSFQRYNDMVCYVIGRPFEKGKPYAGLWIEKNTFFPRIYVVEKNGWIVEFFYNNWQRVSKTWYPMQISIFIDNQLFAMVNVKTFDLSSQISPSLFDIGHIEQMYPRNDSDSLNENDKHVDELDKRIEEFKKLYE